MNKAWFRRGSSGLGIFPQAWQGWACLGVFIAVLLGSVQLVEALLPEGKMQGAAFVVAAIEIMAFMSFARRHAGPVAQERKE